MAPNQYKAIFHLRLMISFACLLCGFLAGENIFRYSMEVPAWRHIDISIGNYGDIFNHLTTYK